MKAKISILLIITTLLTGNLSVQNYSLLVTPTFKPRTFNEMLIDAYIAAHARAVNQQKFQQYTAAAYEALASGDDEAFIQYSTYALRTVSTPQNSISTEAAFGSITVTTNTQKNRTNLRGMQGILRVTAHF